METPKITLRVQIVDDKEAIIELLYVTSAFGDFSKIHTKSQWNFKKGPKFDIDFYQGIMIFPIKPDRDKDRVVIRFENDSMRKMLLKDLNRTLLEWSGDMLFKSIKYFDEPHIKYNQNLWIIY